MDTIYILEIYDPIHRKYCKVWEGRDIEWANKMYDKPYNRRYTRRVVRVTRELMFKDKGDDKIKRP